MINVIVNLDTSKVIMFYFKVEIFFIKRHTIKISVISEEYLAIPTPNYTLQLCQNPVHGWQLHYSIRCIRTLIAILSNEPSVQFPCKKRHKRSVERIVICTCL